MSIRIAFYKYDKKFFNAIISAWTWLFNPRTPSYSHVEVGIKIGENWKYFSSTTRGDARGTRWIAEKKLFKHPDRWDVYEIDAHPDSLNAEEYILKRANEILGQPYDWLGLSGFAMPFGFVNSKKRWYCSEACYYILTGVWKKRISPRKFYSYLKRFVTLRKIKEG
jgi:hypothetical protein